MKRLLPLMALALLGCEQRDWQGWVYPDRNNLTVDIPIGAFTSLEECSASARAVVARFDERRDEDGETIKGDYECGFKCKPDQSLGGLNVCEKTER